MKNQKTSPNTIDQLIVHKGVQNPYLPLLQEAELLIELAKSEKNTDRAIRLSRSAVRCLCHAPEALVNLAITHFGQGELFDWLHAKNNERKLKLIDKYVLLHNLCNVDSLQKIDLTTDPFKALEEIISIRNAFSHPKTNHHIWLSHDNFFRSKEIPKKIASELNIKEPDLAYPLTGIPRNFSWMNAAHALKLKSIVEEIESRVVDIFSERAMEKGGTEWSRNEVLRLHKVYDMNA